jgi:hypothetical protein
MSAFSDEATLEQRDETFSLRSKMKHSLARIYCGWRLRLSVFGFQLTVVG